MANERPWYFRDQTVTLALLALLVLALPLLWLSPYYTLRRKIIISIIVVVGTYYSIIWTADALKMLNTTLESMK